MTHDNRKFYFKNTIGHLKKKVKLHDKIPFCVCFSITIFSNPYLTFSALFGNIVID